ncbi:COG4315 family predicted lipoprotein [Jatrophihabitans fulvus]
MLRATLATLAACLLLAGCGSSSSPSGDPALPQRAAAAVRVQTVTVPGLGSVLADGRGHVLYMFPPDARQQVRCTGACAGTWPPLALADGRRPSAGPGVTASRLGTLPDPNTGARIVTYRGYPLYTYAGDVTAGTARGQALNLNGGPWYVLDPAGEPITRTVAS